MLDKADLDFAHLWDLAQRSGAPFRQSRLCRRILALLLPMWLAAGAAPTAAQGATPETRPPNILLIMTDDQGYGDIASHGNPWVKTPHLDALAEAGVRFERFFVEPRCAPTRAALLTGRYPTRTGVHGVTRGLENMRADEVTLATLLRDRAGYATGCFGKWHNGAHWPYHPLARGFDHFTGFCGGHWNNYYDPMLERDGEPFRARGFIVDVLTDEAIGFMRQATEKGRPFFCYVPWNTPHTPASAPVEDWKRWADHPEVGDDFTRAMYALCENIDRNTGRLLAALDEMGAAENTVVFFLTDNGPNGVRYNAGMLGRKSTVHEGGVRVPLFVRWPGRIAPGRVLRAPAAHIDLLPTICAFAGIADPGVHTLPLDGVDLSALLLGDDGAAPPERLFYTWLRPGVWSIRSARHRATAEMLHDLVDDPGQKRDLARELPKVHRALVQEYLKWEAGAVAAVPAPQAVHLGFAEWPRVEIGAHEFDLHPGAGRGIDYCNPGGYANQWITKWTNPTARAECRLRVVRAGRYRVMFRYAATPESVGSRFALAAGSARLEFEITEPWISAPRPAPEQGPRSSGGYLSREWKDVPVGEMDLAAGDHVLQVLALRAAGPSLPDVKAVIFEAL